MVTSYGHLTLLPDMATWSCDHIWWFHIWSPDTVKMVSFVLIICHWTLTDLDLIWLLYPLTISGHLINWPYLVTLSVDHIWSPYPLIISGHLIHWPYMVTIYVHFMVTIFAKLLTDLKTVTELLIDLHTWQCWKFVFNLKHLSENQWSDYFRENLTTVHYITSYRRSINFWKANLLVTELGSMAFISFFGLKVFEREWCHLSYTFDERYFVMIFFFSF